MHLLTIACRITLRHVEVARQSGGAKVRQATPKFGRSSTARRSNSTAVPNR